MEPLRRMEEFEGPRGPVVLVIMDGIGIGSHEQGDMVRQANTPTLDWLADHALYSQLKAHGRAVGMPSDSDMGNSEIGHNAIGCGRVFDQGASLVNKAIADRSLFNGDVWQELIDTVLQHASRLHFIGLLSDGNVHSHINHLEALLLEAKDAGVKQAALHILLDGRDVPPTSALEYVDRLEKTLAELNRSGDVDFAIASGGGRMKITMDRYEADWEMVALGWQTHVKGEGRQFDTARQAVEILRQEHPGVIDQDLPPFVIARNQKPIGPVSDHDGVICFNFRGDRAIELSRAFEEDDFREFERGPKRNVIYAGMMQYDGDLMIPQKFLVPPPGIDRTMGEYLAASGIRQLAISETQKFGHVTYFFNGNRSGKFNDALEDYVEVPSDRVPFEQRPWMKAAEITDKVIEALHSGKHRFIRLNYANGDMVGHTGNVAAVQIAVESVDLSLNRLVDAVRAVNGILVVTADHGNSDDMYIRDKKTGKVAFDPETGMPKTKTSHSLNPVPVYIYNTDDRIDIRLADRGQLGISSLAATCLMLLGYTPPQDYTPSIVAIG